MATTSKLLFAYENGQRIAFSSQNAAVLFHKLGFTNNGADQGIEISSDGVGFDFGNSMISNFTMNASSLISDNSITQAKFNAPGAAEGRFLQTDGTDMSWAEVGLIKNLANLYDVTLSSIANNDLLRYSTATNTWINEAVDNSTLEISSSTLHVKSSGITATQLADNAVIQSKINATGASAGRYLQTNGSSLSWVDVSLTFEFTNVGVLTSNTNSYSCTSVVSSTPTAITVVQLMTNGWQPIPLVDSIWVTNDSNKYLQGNIDDLVPSVSNPVRITVR